MQSYFPNGEVTAKPYAGDNEDHPRAEPDLLAQEGRQVRGARDLRRRVPGGFRPQDHRMGLRLHDPFQGRGQAVLRVPAVHAGAHPADSRPRVRGQDQARELGRHPHPDGRLHRRDPRQARRARSSPTTPSSCGRPTTAPTRPIASRRSTRTRRAVNGTGSRDRGGAGCSPRSKARTGRRASSVGPARFPRARSATSSSTRSTSSRRS